MNTEEFAGDVLAIATKLTKFTADSFDLCRKFSLRLYEVEMQYGVIGNIFSA